MSEVAGVRSETLLKKKLRRRYFPVNFVILLTTPKKDEDKAFYLVSITLQCPNRIKYSNVFAPEICKTEAVAEKCSVKEVLL